MVLDVTKFLKPFLIEYAPLLSRANRCFMIWDGYDSVEEYQFAKGKTFQIGNFISILTGDAHFLLSTGYKGKNGSREKYVGCFIILPSNMRKTVFPLFNKFSFKSREFVQTHRHLGNICGYPPCCIENYVNHHGDSRYNNHSSAVIATFLKKCGIKNQFGISLIGKSKLPNLGKLQYIPCSPKCKESLRRLRIVNAFLKKVRDGDF